MQSTKMSTFSLYNPFFFDKNMVDGVVATVIELRYCNFRFSLL